MLYVDGPRVYHELSRNFYWSNVINQIKMICKACEPCQTAKVRRQQLSAAFEQADTEDLPPPSIDFYGHTLSFVNDEAKDFVDGVVHNVMNRYHGIKHITTGGIALDLT